MPNDIPVNEVVQMVQQGFMNEEITRNLEAKGYNLQQISDAINQAQIKQGIRGELSAEAPPAPLGEDVPAPGGALETEFIQQQAPPTQNMYQSPTPTSAPPQSYGQQQYYQMPAQSGLGYDDVQALVEQVVEEKWREEALPVIAEHRSPGIKAGIIAVGYGRVMGKAKPQPDLMTVFKPPPAAETGFYNSHGKLGGDNSFLFWT